jgi:hypothetical protein
MDAEESSIKERIKMMRKEYSVLNENMKLDECGLSQALRNSQEKNDYKNI